MFKLTGSVKRIKDTVQISEKFSKREFVINDTSSMYPQDILFQSSQDKCGVLDGFKENDEVEVSFNIRGREWTSPTGEVKYFNTLDAWRIEKFNTDKQKPAPKPIGNIEANFQEDAINQMQEDDDDLPF